MEFIRKHFREPFPGISHGIGAILSVAGLLFLLWTARGEPLHVVAFAIYGTSMIVLYMASALCHSLPVDVEGEIFLDKIDRCAVYGLIAGTYTPICLLALHGGWRWTMLGVEWGLALFGILSITLGPNISRWVRTIPYIIMGWLAIVAIVPLHQALSPEAFVLLFVGGGVYSLGVVVFLANRPVLWPGHFVAHDLWHVLVLAGSAIHFVLIARFLA